MIKLEILIKYFDPNMPRIEKLEIGNWIDLRSRDEVFLKSGIYSMVDLGVAMKLPEGYEAIIAPRSSSFKNWGALQVNGLGIIDEKYCGDDDVWKWAVYPTRDCLIEKYSRVCQFRIQEKQPEIVFSEVFALGLSRGGFGSTGIK
jgi:dUTP pyrophosphatase